MIKNLSDKWPILLLITLSSLILWPLFLPGFFSHQDSLQVMRIFEMRRCFNDLQIPCRWVPDMGDGYGYPLFNYYGVLPYYIGAILSFILGFIGAAKALFFIPLLLGGITMYLFVNQLSNKYAGFVAGILYMFAPYRAVDSYVRGDITESFAIFLIPLVFLFCLRLIKKRSYLNFIGTSVSLGLFLLCHNVMTLFFIPVLIIWVAFCLITFGFRNSLYVLSSLILGFGISAFFILPAFFEISLVQADTLRTGVYDFHAHFVSLNQLFISRFWGYGITGQSDKLSFQIGWPIWWLLVLALPLLKRMSAQTIKLVLLFAATFLFAAFLTHNKSTFIWESLPLLQFAQFPWRFLAVVIFSGAVIGGLSILTLPEKWQKCGVITVSIVAILLNFQFFKPETFYYNQNERSLLSGPLWEIQQKGSITDYLPNTAKIPDGIAPSLPQLLSGHSSISSFQKGSNNWNFQASVSQTAKIEVPVFGFPVWKVMVDNKPYPEMMDSLGRIAVNLTPGNYMIQGSLANTPIRQTANLISIVSIVILVASKFLFNHGYGKTRD